MKKFIRLLVLLLVAHRLNAQVNLDSIEKTLATLSDTNKINTLNNLSFEYSESNYKRSLDYARQAIVLSDRNHFVIGKAKAFNNIGIAFDVTGNYDSALYYYDASLKISRALNNKKQISNTLNNIGLVFWNKGDYDKGLNYYLQSLKLFEEINNKKGIANNLSNIGLIYEDLKKPQVALTYHLRSLKIREEIKDNYGIGVSLTNIGLTYQTLGDNEKSLNFLLRSLKIKKQNKDLYGVAICLGDIGILYHTLGRLDIALDYELQALAIRNQMDDKYGLITTYNNISGIYEAKKNYALALQYSMRSLALANELKSKSKLKTVYREISNCYEKLQNSDQALLYYKKYAALNDSIYSEEGARQIAEVQTKYETGKKDFELGRKNLELEKNKLEIGQQKTQRNILLISIIALALITFLLYNRYKLKQKNLIQKERSDQQTLRTRAIVEAEENERTRIARELHDGIGQQLSAAKLNLSSLKSVMNSTNEVESSLMNNIIAIIDDSVKEVRSVSHSMMPNALLKSGLATAVREFLNRINTTDKFKIELEISGLNERLDGTTENILFRVVQEAVNNIIKHSEATIVNIQLVRYEEELSIMIQDNGIGFDPTIESKGIGLKNIRSRIDFINGMVSFDSSPGRGTTIIIEIPMFQTV